MENNLTSAIGSAPETDKITLYAIWNPVSEYMPCVISAVFMIPTGSSVSRQCSFGSRDGILERNFQQSFLGKTRVFSDSIICLVFYPHLSVLQNAIHEKIRVFFFRGFFCKDFKNVVFFEIRQQKGLRIAWSKRLLLNQCPEFDLRLFVAKH